jgi:outer membrane protein assembly factor BamB
MRRTRTFAMRSFALAATIAVIVLLTLGAVLGTGQESEGSSAPRATQSASAKWVQPNGNLSNHRRANSRITSDNVDGLGVAWEREITGTTNYGSFASTPLIADGVAYLQDLQSNVQAVDLETGATLWTRDYNEPGIGPNGLLLHRGTLYGITVRSAFALNPADGSELWRTVVPGASFRGTPQFSDRRIFVVGRVNRQGAVVALDADTGSQLWSFSTVLQPSAFPEAAAGGLWNTALIDPNGDVYVGTGNTYHTPRDGLERPDELLYTNSLLKLGPRTGTLRWYYQAVPNDFYDWDLHLSPVWVRHRGASMVIAAGKMGYIYAVNPRNGRLIWKTPVGDHNGHDTDSLRALEDPGSVTDKIMAEISDGDGMQLEPGVYGGVETNMAYQNGVIYAAIVNLETTLCAPPELQPPSCLDVNYGGQTGTFDFTDNEGEMVALDVRTGRVLWSTRLPTMALGAATISNDLVFTTTFEGKVVALSREDGSIVWQGDLGVRTNAQLSIAGDTLITAASYPEEGQGPPKVVAYRLGASGP